MRRALFVLLALVAVLAVTGTANAAEPEWRSEQPLGPEGRAPLGPVGDVECWEASRCLLITAGNGGMPAGLYAYDGTHWYLYSTVCGGHQGRIAWAGPNDFWTISDQVNAQKLSGEGAEAGYNVSLCHFVNGAVVASYAEPLGVGTSYKRMNAATCNGPNECWFAGERLPGTTNVGAFHLYWNGLTLSAAPSLTELQPGLRDPGREVTGLSYYAGALYESVQVQSEDRAEAETGEPSLLHQVIPGTLPEFKSLYPPEPIDFGAPGAKAEEFDGFLLSSDAEGLWEAGGPTSADRPAAILRVDGSGLHQVQLDDQTGALEGVRLKGLAADPGTGAAWVSFARHSDRLPPAPGVARLALVHPDGTVDPPIELPADGEQEGVGPQGRAGPVTCPATNQCWIATESGWLFHLGPDPGANPSPMQPLISFRPADNSLPSVPPLGLPEDDSGSTAEKAESPLEIQEEPLPRHIPPLLSKLHQKLLGRRTLELSFVLRAKAHVQLIAKRKGVVVAKTKRFTMAKGHRKLLLKLDPKRWPTKLDLQVHAVKKKTKAAT